MYMYVLGGSGIWRGAVNVTVCLTELENSFTTLENLPWVRRFYIHASVLLQNDMEKKYFGDLETSKFSRTWNSGVF